jgi:hypothetical protein
MSGAAGLSAAKNRRSKSDPNQKQLPPPMSCGKNGSCPPQKSSQNLNNNKSAILPTKINDLVEPNSLKILGPLPPVEILKLHEQRLNRFDERLDNLSNQCSTVPFQPIEQLSAIDESEIDDCFTRLENLESKVGMLEEVIMTLQNKLTIAQNFAMETNLSMTQLIKKQDQLQLEQALNLQKSNISLNVVDITQLKEESDSNSNSGMTTPDVIEVSN